MRTLLDKVSAFLRDESGTETVEWAILAALLLIVVASVWVLLGGEVKTKINDIYLCLKDGACGS